MRIGANYRIKGALYGLVLALVGSGVEARADRLVPEVLPPSILPDALARLVSTPFATGQTSLEFEVPNGFTVADCLRCRVPGQPGLIGSFAASREPAAVTVRFANPAPIDGAVVAFFWKPHQSVATVRECFVSEDGGPNNHGTEDSPWDFRSALDGSQKIEPGSLVWFKGGTYSDPQGPVDLDRVYRVALVGEPELPIHIRALPGDHVRIEGGFQISAPAAHLWIGGFEFYNSDPVPGGEPTPPGSVPDPLPNGFTDWGGAGIAVMSGKNHVIYNNVTHGGAHAFSAWNVAHGTVFMSNVAYDAGWIGEDRAHGHCLYAQNLPETGTKTVRHNLFSARSRTVSGNYGLHFYAKRPILGGFQILENAVKGPIAVRSDNSHCEQIRFMSNIACSSLVRSTPEADGRGNSFGKYNRPDRGMVIRDNTFIDGVKRLENCGWEDLDAASNRVIKTNSKWWANDIGTRPAHAVTESGEFIDYSLTGGPDEFRLWPNQIDRDRAHLAVMDFDRSGSVMVDVGDFLEPGDHYRIVHYRNLEGRGVWVAPMKSVFRGGRIKVKVIETDDALDMFVLLRHR